MQQGYCIAALRPSNCRCNKGCDAGGCNETTIRPYCVGICRYNKVIASQCNTASQQRSDDPPLQQRSDDTPSTSMCNKVNLIAHERPRPFAITLTQLHMQCVLAHRAHVIGVKARQALSRHKSRSPSAALLRCDETSAIRPVQQDPVAQQPRPCLGCHALRSRGQVTISDLWARCGANSASRGRLIAPSSGPAAPCAGCSSCPAA